MKRTIVVAVAMALSGSLHAAQKFDASLASVMTSGNRSGVPLMAKAADRNSVPVLIKVNGDDISYLETLGVQVRSRLGNIVSANVPVASLPGLLTEDRITYIEAERPMIGRLNFSVPATKANLIRQGTAPNFSGATGAGVIVGVIDDGLDFRHLDFRKPDGSTRLLGLWDQRVSGAAGSPPAGFAYGGECTVTMLNDAIGGNAAACTQPSSGNHGSHVGGIAAGNGQQTGNAQPAYRFIGMAPLADMLAANSIAGGVGGNAVVDAIAWMKAKAQAAGKPIVINLSLGSYFGSRDGTSNFELALSNAGDAGVVLVAAAGNEGRDAIRAGGTISQGETQTVSFNWANTVTQGQRMEMWYPGSNQYAVRVNGPGGCTTGFHAAGSTNTYNLACGTLEIISTGVQASNDDRQILVNFTPANPVAGSQGNWTIDIRGDTVAQASTPFSLICGEDGGGLLFTSNTTPVTTQILTDTSSATRTIGVAAYNTNYTWNQLGGGSFTAGGAGQIGDVSDFSSRGPRRNCSNAAKCPPIQKPEITAPGALIMSSLGQDAAVPNDGTTEADGKHVAYNGTSMATPHVSGAVALMLQKNKTLTPEQVKGILFANVQTNAFTTGLPSIAWGNGILNAEAAVLATPSPIKARHDQNGDGKSDIVWRNGSTGQNWYWGMNGTAITSQGPIVTIPVDWQIQSTAVDFDGDGKADILLRNMATGQPWIWFMNGNTIIGGGGLPVLADLNWTIAGTGDLNGDGKGDIVWRNVVTGQNWHWGMLGTEIILQGPILTLPPEWQIQSTLGDLNGDGKTDIVWRNMTTGQPWVWIMDGHNIINNGPLPTLSDLNWNIVGTGDLNGDGRDDIIWRNAATGQNWWWGMDGQAITAQGPITSLPTDWQIQSTSADFDGDGKADILLRNMTTGQPWIWFMNGNLILNGGPLPTLSDLNWQIRIKK